MEKIMIIDKNFWEYKKLLFKIAWRNSIKHFEGWKKFVEPLIVATFTAICSWFAIYLFKGSISSSDLWIIIFSSIGGVVLFGIFIFMAKLLYASYESSKEKEMELRKYDLVGIDFSIIPYSIVGSEGWAIKVENGKDFDLNQVLMEIKNVLVGEKYAIYEDKEPNSFVLKFIEETNEMLDKKINEDYSGNKSWIPKGRARIFILTRNSVNSWEFESMPKNLNLLEKGIEKKYIEENNPILEVEFRCSVKDGKTVWCLPFRKIEIERKNDGSFYRRK